MLVTAVVAQPLRHASSSRRASIAAPTGRAGFVGGLVLGWSMAGHPVLAALPQARAALEHVLVRDDDGQVAAWASLDDAPLEELRSAVRLVAELEGQVAGLRLHAVAAAEACEARIESGAADTAAWAASAGRNRDRCWGSLWLAQRVEQRYHHVRAALAQGRLSHEHAMVVVRAARRSRPRSIRCSWPAVRRRWWRRPSGCRRAT